MIFRPERSLPDISATSTKILDKEGSPDRFGYSWERFKRPTESQLLQFIRWTQAIGRDAWRAKTFLDVGCGTGRNSLWAMRLGAKGGAAIDIDERSLRVARQTLHHHKNVEVKFQSVYTLGDSDLYDIVFCIGVLHHLEDPSLALSKLIQAAKPGGRVLVWVYGFENNEWIARWFDPFRRHIFSRLPLPVVVLIAWPVAVGLWLLLHSRIKKGEYLTLLRSFTLVHLWHIVFDQLIPRVTRYYRGNEIQKLFVNAGLSEVETRWVNENSWSVVGTKMADTSPGNLFDPTNVS